MGIFLYYSGASRVAEGRIVTERINEIQATVVKNVPAEIWRLLRRGDSAGPQLGGYFAAFGRAVMNGRRTYEWFKAYAPRQHRPRVHETAVKAREAILAYVAVETYYISPKVYGSRLQMSNLAVIEEH